MRIILTLVLFILCGLSLSAQAQVEDPILALPEGQAIISISATERVEVEQDLLVANLTYSVIDREPRTVQSEINSLMAKALARAKSVSSVKVNTGAYQVYEHHEPRTKERKWRGSQSLTLKSKTADDLLKLAGDLQDLGLTMNGLSYMLAPETSVKIQDSLMEAALRQLQTRANRAAKALGKSKASLREITVQGSGAHYQPRVRHARMEMDSMSKGMAAPVAASGETTITLTVSARALLKR